MMPHALHPFDWIVIGLYLAAVMLLGLYAAGKQESTRDYFVGSRQLPWWAVTLSIIATETSAVTYIGLPGLAYRADWYFLQIVAGYVLARIVLAAFFVKVFYRFDLTTVYGFLEYRFGKVTRTVAALIFLLGRVVASAVRLFAACLAVQVATGLGIELSIVCLGVLGLAYTFLGGIRAVVWTDCILGLTFIVGGLISIVFIVYQIDGGLGTVFAHTDFAEKIRIFHASAPEGTSWAAFLASEKPFLVGVLGGFVLTLATHGTDQDIVQRVLCCEDGRQGARSLVASAVVILPLMTLFLAVGTLLWFLHQIHPELKPELPVELHGNHEDYYFPIFTVRQLPRGLSGLVFAGVFAAALSSLTSVLNALAATTITDFYRPLRPRASEPHYLLASRVATLFWGAALMLLAWSFTGSQDSILKIALKALMYFYGSLLGVFLLGIFTKRGTQVTSVLGMVTAVPCVLLLQLKVFLEDPSQVPDLLGAAIGGLPPAFTDWVLARVPTLAWPLWICIGTGVTFLVAMAGKEAIARRG